MAGAILIAVSDGFGGYGDFLFALKLAEQIKNHYIDLVGPDNAPEVKLITQATGQEKIKKLKGDTEFGVEVLTPNELKEKVDNKELEVASLIEGPVFQSSLIFRIDSALQKQNNPIPLVMIPEYACSDKFYREMIENHRQFRKECLSKMVYLETIYTGFNSKGAERGIILSDNLINQDKPSELALRLEDKIGAALLKGEDIDAYQSNTDMYFQYSHDTFSTTPETTAAKRFLKIHRIYSKGSKKNQDILMVGKTERTKREALERVKKQLIADGFTTISFYNADTKKEKYLFGKPDIEGRHYRVVYTSGMTHASMIAAQALSGDLVGATGDQSFGEAVSGDKILIYECLSHKRSLRDEYYNQLIKLDPSCKEILDLLRNGDWASDYRRMELLLTEKMKVKLKTLSKRFRESGELTQFAVNAAMPTELLSLQIISGAISPYNVDSASPSSFERTLMFGRFEAVSHVLDNHTSTIDERRKFCQILTKKDQQGRALISALRQAKLDSPETKRASYLVTQFNLDKYKVKVGTKRETMFNAYKELISTFTILGENKYSEDALIGLMLLTTKSISKEYTFLSPRKGLFFGSQFYSNLEDTLNDLGIDLKHITTEERTRYYSALAQVMENNPNLIANEYILNSLSKEANIKLPKIPPLLSERTAQELLRSKKSSGSDPTAFRTRTGLYKIHPEPLGQGGWGSVHAARHYALTGSGVTISSPLAIKMMSKRHEQVMDKEERMFRKVYPDEHFERFNRNQNACLAMPLFPGLPLDDYLNNNLELNSETRKDMVRSLLENLQEIHDAKITHNDLKPKNILFDPVSKKIHIIDFGCAEEVGTMLKYRNFDTAVFAFEMPPEYMHGINVNPKLDIFSLTSVIAEILGVNKKEFVRARMEGALSKINNPLLVNAIRQAYIESGSLELALFSRKVYPLTHTKDFNLFVNNYVNSQYDFSPYKEILGDQAFDLLNAMQHHDPDHRPSIDEALEMFDSPKEKITLEVTL